MLTLILRAFIKISYFCTYFPHLNPHNFYPYYYYSRYILIKYADRGLVTSEGKVSKLFDNLYITIAVSMHSFCFSGIPISHYLGATGSVEPAVISVCLEHHMKTDKDTWKYPMVMIGVILTAITPMWILYLSSRRYVWVRSATRDLPPAIYGRYQRNIVTYSQTIWIFTIFTVSSMICMSLTTLTQDVSWHFVLIIQVFCFVAYVSCNYPRKTKVNRVADLEMKPSIFYIRSPHIIPRRDENIKYDEAPALNQKHFIVVQPILL